MNFEFQFKHFGLNHSSSSMKITTDAVLLGALACVENAKNILEIGCGCGIISLMLAQRSNAKIDAIDIHEHSVKQANENFSHTSWSNRLNAMIQDARTYHAKRKYDLIISNPPYYINSLLPASFNKQLSRHDHSLKYSELCFSIYRNLNSNGSFWLILPESNYDSFSQESTNNGLYCNNKIEISDKLNKPASLMISSWSFSPTPLEIQKFFLKNPDNSFSEMYIRATKNFYFNF